MNCSVHPTLLVTMIDLQGQAGEDEGLGQDVMEFIGDPGRDVCARDLVQKMTNSSPPIRPTISASRRRAGRAHGNAF